MNDIIHGDALQVLRTMPAESVQTIITSPPYWNLRDYGVNGQIGLETSPFEYIAKLVEVFHEARRVLRNDGTFWLNLGDSYAGSGKGGQSDEKRSENWQPTYGHKGITPLGFKPKDLMMMPARVAIALCDDGWYLRQDIIWAKSNPMPESVPDRPTTAHEHIFLLAKSERYFYDAAAIREESKTWAGQSGTFARTHGKATLLTIPGQAYASHRDNRDDRVPDGRNKRSVWTVATHPYPDAHFACFPLKLIEPCILAGSSPRACEHCNAPWERVTEREFVPQPDVADPLKLVKASNKGLDASNGWGATPRGTTSVTTAGWRPTCTCANNTGSGKCVVLDPFLGSGTTALMALKHNRNYVGIELNPEYIEMAKRRVSLGPLWECEEEITA